MCSLPVTTNKVSRSCLFGDPRQHGKFSSYRALKWEDGRLILPTFKASNKLKTILIAEVGILNEETAVFFLQGTELIQLKDAESFEVIAEEVYPPEMDELKKVTLRWLKTSVFTENWTKMKFYSSKYIRNNLV
jgi:hypothetical protein